MITMVDRLLWVLIAAGVLCVLPEAKAQTLYVDVSHSGCPGSGSPGDPYCRIQDAIAAASPGSTIRVAPGTYFESIDFLGKAITVISESGPNATVIDGGQGVVATVTFQTDESQDSVLEGFTIQNGRGGISCFQTSPTIQENKIVNNMFLSGIRCISGSPVIRSNTISYNTGTIGNAGGIYCAASSAFISNNVIQGNTGRYGGGISCRSGQPKITSNRIIDNTATDIGGGGVFMRTSDAVVVNNEIVRNVANTGGGVYTWGAPSGVLVNNTIAENSSTTYGGAIYSLDAQTIIQNSIIWDNGPTAVHRQGGSIQVSYSDIQGGYAGSGNLNTNPKFMDPSMNDFRLACDSPCLDVGTSNPVTVLPSFDQSGRDDRIIGQVDLGADELGVLWSLVGPPIPGGAPVYFAASSAPSLAGDLSEIYLSLGNGESADGIPVPGADGRRLFLDFDLLLNIWLTLPSVLRSVNLTGCPPAGTFPFVVPPNISPGLNIWYASVSWDLSQGKVVSLPLSKSFAIQ